jgi:uroporphyrinogen-III synthase
MKLLVIRPQPGADATAARVMEAGHEPLLMPLFAVEPVAWDAPSADGYDGLILTSANAVRQAGPALAAFAHLPSHSVGKTTARAANEAGLLAGQTGVVGVDDLLSALEGRRLLWLAGEDHTAFAAPPSAHVDMRIVYRSAALPVPASFHDMTMRADHVLLHSPRAAGHFASLVADQALDRAYISIGALSGSIANAAGSGWKSVHVAAQPSDTALLSCL